MAMSAKQAMLASREPSRGMELRHAMTFYGDQAFARTYIVLAVLSQVQPGCEGALSHGQLGELASLRRIFIEDLLNKLRQGDLVARGYRFGDITPTELPADWWCAVLPAQVDLQKNGAEAHGSRFTGIFVYPAATPRQASAPPRRASRATVWREYQAAFSNQHPTKRAAEAWARQQFPDARGVIGWVREIHGNGPKRAVGRPIKNC
jgi:hypothetical protein